MEDDNTKDTTDQPTTSKKVTQRDSNSMDNRDNRDDRGTYSDDSIYSKYSTESELNEPNTNTNDAKMTSRGEAKIEAKDRGKKKRTQKKTIIGRVEKKKRPAPRRQVTRRAPKRRLVLQAREREISSSTIFTRLSSSGTLGPTCNHCGHRCCRRRFDNKLRMRFCGKCRRKVRIYYGYKETTRKSQVVKAPPNKFMRSEAIQTGSRSKMLSPLYIRSNSAPVENTDLCWSHSEITPEMIYESLRRLTMWRQNVPTSSILDYLSQVYPVNNNKEALLKELCDKLTVCVMTGIVCQSPNETWCLSCKLVNRKLKKKHVTLFWQLYSDTLKPIKKVAADSQKETKTNDQASQRNKAKRNTLTIFDEDII